ncbi:uncharacterized protein EHS24_005631 [Apiotrichum porosum]|uniref:Uncharacterized protein n=1 Tax=Apiotrichum porosum TaxID=105984 RepID=A0A427XZ19_9TREE|nr:uncharacterized protein EHS24_005631 [Apiotrichum porosum]RSH84128.1 hypothetical protein EHS24_005631 [Apiotrichum porosum]
MSDSSDDDDDLCPGDEFGVNVDEPHYFKQLIPGPRICIYCGEEEDMTDDDSDDDDYQP